MSCAENFKNSELLSDNGSKGNPEISWDYVDNDIAQGTEVNGAEGEIMMIPIWSISGRHGIIGTKNNVFEKFEA